MPTKCNSGILAMKVPDPPQFAPSAICAISADGAIAAVGGRDVELLLWSVDTGDLLSKIGGHDIFWVSGHDNTFFVTCQEDGKVGEAGGRRAGSPSPLALGNMLACERPPLRPLHSKGRGASRPCHAMPCMSHV